MSWTTTVFATAPLSSRMMWTAPLPMSTNEFVPLGRVHVRRAGRVVAVVCGHRALRHDHEARPGVRVPAAAGNAAAAEARIPRVLLDVEVRVSLRLELGLPDVGRDRVRLDVEVAERRLRQRRAAEARRRCRRRQHLASVGGDADRCELQRARAISTSSLLLSGRDRLDDAEGIEAGAAGGLRSVTRRRGVEHVEADLVVWDVDRAVETDARCPSRQLRRCRGCPPLASCALVRLPAGEICLDEVARHPLDAMTWLPRWKRQNVGTLERPRTIPQGGAGARARSASGCRALRRCDSGDSRRSARRGTAQRRPLGSFCPRQRGPPRVAPPPSAPPRGCAR